MPDRLLGPQLNHVNEAQTQSFSYSHALGIYVYIYVYIFIYIYIYICIYIFMKQVHMRMPHGFPGAKLLERLPGGAAELFKRLPCDFSSLFWSWRVYSGREYIRHGTYVIESCHRKMSLWSRVGGLALYDPWQIVNGSSHWRIISLVTRGEVSLV